MLSLHPDHRGHGQTGVTPKFRPGTAFFMPNATGPCRFGQYHRFHRLVLDELGFPEVPVYAPDQDETFYQDLGMVGDGL